MRSRLPGVDHVGVFGENLMPVDVAQGNVVQLRAGKGAQHEDGVTAQEHGLLGACPGGVQGDVGGQQRGHGRVKALDLPGHQVGHPLLELPVDLVYGEAAGLLPGQERAAPNPGQGDYLHRARRLSAQRRCPADRRW